MKKDRIKYNNRSNFIEEYPESKLCLYHHKQEQKSEYYNKLKCPYCDLTSPECDCDEDKYYGKTYQAHYHRNKYHCAIYCGNLYYCTDYLYYNEKLYYCWKCEKQSRKLKCNMLQDGLVPYELDCICNKPYCVNLTKLSVKTINCIYKNTKWPPSISCKGLREDIEPERINCKCRGYCKTMSKLTIDSIIKLKKSCAFSPKCGQKHTDDIAKLEKCFGTGRYGTDRPWYSLILGEEEYPKGKINPFDRKKYIETYKDNEHYLRMTLLVAHYFFEYSGYSGYEYYDRIYYYHEFPKFSIKPQNFHVTDLILKYSF